MGCKNKSVTTAFLQATTALANKHQKIPVGAIALATSALKVGRHAWNRDPENTAGAIGEIFGIAAGDLAAGCVIVLTGMTGIGAVLIFEGIGLACTFAGREAGRGLFALVAASSTREHNPVPNPPQHQRPSQPHISLVERRKRALRRAGFG